MEASPLELYQTAYRFHYNENRIGDAVAYYQKLIKEFPDSNECGYAVIQLQKIKAHSVAESLQTISSHGAPSMVPLYLFCILTVALTSAAAGFLYLHFSRLISAEQKRTSLALNALGKISRGENEEALILLTELKGIHTNDIVPYELSANIYRKQRKWNEARREYTTFFQNNPDRKPSESERKYMYFDEKTVAKKKPDLLQNSKNIGHPVPVTQPPVPGSLKKKGVRKKSSFKNNPPAPSSKKKDGILLVNPDSISYF